MNGGRLKVCPNCNNDGRHHDRTTQRAIDECERCGGSGMIRVPEELEDYLVDLVVEKWDA